MANLSAVIVPAKALRGRRHRVRIAVSHNSDVRYILTDLLVENPNEFKNGSFRNRPDAAFLNTKLRRLLQRYQDALAEIEYVEGLTCAEVVFLIKNGDSNKNKTITDIYNEYLDVVVKTDGSRRAYAGRFRSISKFLTPDFLVRKINHSTILGLTKYYESKNLSPMTIRIRLLFLKTLVNYAVKCGYCEFKINPFNAVPIPENVIRQAWLTVDEIKLIRDADIKSRKERRCRDLFMLSYYLGGINLTDLMNINFNEQKETLRYMRQKTRRMNRAKQHVEFEIPPEALEIIGRIKNPDGRINLSERERQTVCSDLFFVGFPRLAKRLGLGRLIYYSARKSFAQHAFSLGVSTTTIDFILGHSTNKAGVLYHYVKVTPDIASKAIRIVLNNLKN